MGFKAQETMRGHHEFHDGGGPPGQLPFEFRCSWGPDRLRDWLNPASDHFMWQELQGEIRAEGLCDWTPMQGTLHLQYAGKRRIRYDFDFEVDGTGYRYVGDKSNLRLWNLAVTHTTCYGTVTERATDRLVSSGVVLFKLRDLPRLLVVRPGWS